jgi:putative membrane protein
MLWVKAFHIILMVCWFSGLFYLPRIFVYHAMTTDDIGNARFKIMERKLFYGITTPCGVLTILFGIWLLSFNVQSYMHMTWMHLKLGVVALVLVYHCYLGKLVNTFKHDKNTHSRTFYRLLNEVPLLFLIAIVLLVVVQPFGALSS